MPRVRPAPAAAALGLAVALLAPAVPLRGAELEPGPEGIDAGMLVRRAESKLGSPRTFLEAKLVVRRSRVRGVRELHFESYRDLRRMRCFIRVSAPPSLADTSFLWMHPNVWLYDPGEKETSRMAASELRTPWLESDFSLDDLLLGTAGADSYAHRLLGIDPRLSEEEPLRTYVVESVPRRPGRALWPAVVTWIETERGIARRREFRDARGEPLRVLAYGDVREADGRAVPHVWTARVPGDAGRESRIEIETIRFDADFPESVFTTENLKPAN
jgi:hypothetical protein